TTLSFNRADASTYAGAVSGAGGLRKAGAGTLTLTGSSSYTGGTVLAGGTVALGSADALASSGTISFVGGALQYSAANTVDYSARIFTGSGQAFVIDTNGQNVACATGLAGAGNTLTKLGAGTLSLSGSGSFTGATRIVGGTLALASTSALAGSTLDMNAADSGTLSLSLSGSTYSVGGLQGSRSIDVGGNVLAAGSNGQSTTYDGVISGAGGFTKTGTATMLLTATQAYLGTTAVNGGTLRVAASNQLAATGTLSLGGSDATFDIGSTTQTLATMTTANGGAYTNMAVTGSGGSLVLTGPGNLEVGPGGTTAAGQRAVVSLAGIANFSYTVPDGIVRVGLKGGNNQSGAPGVSSLTLATVNTIVSGTLGVGDLGGNNDGGTAQLFLGQTNDIRTSYVQMSASRADSLLQFAPGTTSPTLVLRGTDGSGPAGTWLVGSLGQFSSASKKSFTSTVDLSAGTTDAAVDWLVIGQANCSGAGRGGSMRSTFTMGVGTLTTGSITVGRMTGGSATNGVSGAFSGLGTLAIADPGAVVTATNIYVAENTFTGTGSATKTVSGTIALSAGMLRAGSIARGAQTGTNTVVVNTAFLWTGGTIANLAGSDLTIDTLPLTLSSGTGTFLADAGRTITVNAASPISGAGALVKAGGGTLVLAGANSFTGPTTVSAGTLRLDGGANRLSSGNAVAIAAGGVLDLAGNSQSLGALTGLGTVSTGTGMLTVGVGDVSSTFDGVVSGLGGLTKVGTGIYLLTGTSSYTGPTTVSGGSLLVDGSLGVTAVTVSAAGLLGGSGSILGGVSVVGGTLAPGGAPGRLTIGSLTLDAASTTRFEITGTSAGQYDQVAVNGSLAYGGTLVLDISQALTDGSTLNLFPSFTAFSGNLASVTSVGSAYTAMSFSRTGDLWTSGTASGQSLQFDQATGLL
ncbi:MAG: beta strand repeat-containing protein, partial [Planctomycetaceae bacterium]